MTTFEHAHATVAAEARPSIVVRAVHAVAAVYRTWKNRRAFLQLGEMSDTELADIGLTRADLGVAVGLPFGADPTAHLGRIVARRGRLEAGRLRRD